MSEKKEPQVMVRKLTKQEKEEKLKQQMEREYQREQMKNVQRERSERAKKIYSEDKKRGIIATIINIVILGIAIIIQVLVAYGAVNSTVGVIITAVLVVASFIILKVLTGNKAKKR